MDPIIRRTDAVTPPRLTIANLMVAVAVVAVDFVSVRAFFASRSFVPSPAWEGLLLGVPLFGLALQIGLFRLVRSRGRGRSFWGGFVVSGLVTATIFVGTFAFFPDSADTIPFYWVAYYYELAGGLLYQLLPPHVLAQFPLIWWFGTSIMLFLPQLLIALSGGLLTRLMVEWGAKTTDGDGSQTGSANLLPARGG